MIRRLLVANRAEAARRVFASCRLVGIETVAVYSDVDAAAGYVGEADSAVHLPGSAPTATYLRPDLLIMAARKAGADAVHPGWGLLAADPGLAAAVADAGLAWVGPPAKTLALLADKRATAARLAEAGVPVLPHWSDPGQVEEFPVVVKPVRSRAGQGIRVVRQRADLPVGDVYYERYVAGARHLDLQILRDAGGNTLAFAERECSVQRGRRPLVAESPCPVVHPPLRDELIATAQLAMAALDYVGAATVQLLLAPDGTSHVLGVSPQLPGEHAVSECLAGLDLVRLQLLIAEGAPLPFTGAPPLRGHTIGVALRAEDPAFAWLASTGSLHRFELGPVTGQFRPLPAPGLRLDAGMSAGGIIGAQYDPTLATLVAWAPTRHEAARMLAVALARARVHGVVTNRDLLVRVLRHPAFLTGSVDTGFLDAHPEVFAPLLSSVDSARVSCLAAALAAAADRRTNAPVLGGLPSGWRNVPAGVQTAVFDGPTGAVEIGYRLDRAGELAHWWVRGVDPDELDLAGLGQPNSLPDDHPPVAVVTAAADRVVLDVSGVRLAFSVHQVGPVSYVDSSEGSVVLTEVPRYPLPEPVEEDPEPIVDSPPVASMRWTYPSSSVGSAATAGSPGGASPTSR